MKKIWAPWRIQYISQAHKQDGCILCDKPKENNDESNYVLYRGTCNYVLLNAYPYTPGHLMVAPYRHIGKLTDMSDTESKEHSDLIKLCVTLLTAEVNPAGFNIGMNLGKVAGAGIEDHIHTHVVPRWNGDHNFMTVIADTRVLSEALGETYKRLRTRLADLK